MAIDVYFEKDQYSEINTNLYFSKKFFNMYYDLYTLKFNLCYFTYISRFSINVQMNFNKNE